MIRSPLKSIADSVEYSINIKLDFLIHDFYMLGKSGCRNNIDDNDDGAICLIFIPHFFLFELWRKFMTASFNSLYYIFLHAIMYENLVAYMSIDRKLCHIEFKWVMKISHLVLYLLFLENLQ